MKRKRVVAELVCSSQEVDPQHHSRTFVISSASDIYFDGVLVDDCSINKLSRHRRSETKESLCFILRFNLQSYVSSFVCLFQPNMDRVYDRMAEMSFDGLTHTNRDVLPFSFFRSNTHTFERKFMSRFLRSNLTSEYLKRSQPAFMLTAEAVEEVVPFLAWYLLRRHGLFLSLRMI